jgi:hypothetical protein
MRDRASVLSDLDRFDDALAVLRRIARDERMQTFGFHEQYARARVGARTAAEAMDELLGASSATDVADHEARTLLAVAIASKNDAAVDHALARTPPHDAVVIELLTRATDEDGHWRPRLEAKLEAAAKSDLATEDQRGWFRAVLAGSRAASGDTDAVEPLLADKNNAKSWFWMLRSLDEQRDLALIRRVRERIAATEPDSASGWMERVHMASMDGDREKAIDLIRQGERRWPRNHAYAEYLSIELLLEADDEGHRWADHTMALTTRCYYSHEIAGLSALLRGQRDAAASLVRTAGRLMLPSGHDVRNRRVGGAVLAVLERDRAALERHATARHLHARPEAPVWSLLRSLIEV